MQSCCKASVWPAGCENPTWKATDLDLKLGSWVVCQAKLKNIFAGELKILPGIWVRGKICVILRVNSARITGPESPVWVTNQTSSWVASAQCLPALGTKPSFLLSLVLVRAARARQLGEERVNAIVPCNFDSLVSWLSGNAVMQSSAKMSGDSAPVGEKRDHYYQWSWISLGYHYGQAGFP